MAVKWVGKNIECLAADTKPAFGLVPVNTLATETDTHNEYINNGSAWVLYRAASKTETLTNKLAWYATNGLGIGAFQQIISQSGANIITRAATGGLILSSTVAEEAFQEALDLGGTTYVMGGGVYNFTAGFTGLNISKNNTKLLLDTNAYLRVPNGYTGSCIKIVGTNANIKNCLVQGGIIAEQGGPSEQRLWTGISLETNSLGGCYFHVVRDIEIRTVGIGIKLYNHHQDMAVNSNLFQNITCLYPVVGYDFDSTWPTTNSGMGHNVFINCNTQTGAGGYTQTHGFRNICDGPVIFISCSAWDMPSGKTATIKSTGSQIKIIGGIMDRAGGFFDDNSTLQNTEILQGHAGDTKLILNNTNEIKGKDAAGTPVAMLSMGTNDIINIGSGSDANLDGVAISTGGGTPILISRTAPTLQCGGHTRRVNISEAGLTASRTITFPDAAAKLIGENAAITEGANIVLGSTTGSKIGTATTQKLGFYNKAPIVQPSAIAAPTAGATIDAEARTAINSIRTALTALGLTA